MTKLVEKAFKAVDKLPDEEQDAVASWLPAELASERKWAKTFARSQDKLASLADTALEEHRRGRTEDVKILGA